MKKNGETLFLLFCKFVRYMYHAASGIWLFLYTTLYPICNLSFLPSLYSQAINSAGAGQFSPVAQFQTPASSPGPIASIKVVPGATWATLSWRQPHTNGSDITSYNIDVSDRATPLSVDPVAEYLLEGLQPETSYK